MSSVQQQQEFAAQLIMELEGFRSHAYLDSNNVKTIGYGSTRDNRGFYIRLYSTCTREEARAYLDHHLKKYVFPKLEKFGSLPPRIYAALCSLIYNVGSIGPQISEVVFNKKWDKLPDCFRSYNKINGRECDGLRNRREKEIAYFSKKDDDHEK